MKIAAALLALACGGCAMGQPASLAPASRQAIAPVQTFGFNPVVKQGLSIPVDTAACVTETGINVARDVIQGLRCVLDTLVPIVTPPQSVIQTDHCGLLATGEVEVHLVGPRVGGQDLLEPLHDGRYAT